MRAHHFDAPRDVTGKRTGPTTLVVDMIRDVTLADLRWLVAYTEDMPSSTPVGVDLTAETLTSGTAPVVSLHVPLSAWE